MTIVLNTLEEGHQMMCDEHFVTYYHSHLPDWNDNVIGSMYGDLIEVKGFTRDEFYSLCILGRPTVINNIKTKLRQNDIRR